MKEVCNRQLPLVIYIHKGVCAKPKLHSQTVINVHYNFVLQHNMINYAQCKTKIMCQIMITTILKYNVPLSIKYNNRFNRHWYIVLMHYNYFLISCALEHAEKNFIQWQKFKPCSLLIMHWWDPLMCTAASGVWPLNDN